MKSSWDSTLAAWNLAEAGKWDQALALARDPILVEVLAQRRGKPVEITQPVVAGWNAYYRGQYHEALSAFIKAVGGAKTSHWILGWAQLGIAKVASDSGHWSKALDWCAMAWLTAADGEHLDLMAQIAGARGEILLRAGFPADAADAYSEDLALLPPGSRYRGRIRCYQAHAWARMGPAGQRVAALSYRLAMNTAGEPATATFAAAGLALLATRLNENPAGADPVNMASPGIAEFWLLCAAARMEKDLDARKQFLAQATGALPLVYYAERWWFSAWTASLGHRALSPPNLAECFPKQIPGAGLADATHVEHPTPGDFIPPAPWWDDTDTSPAQSPDEWWLVRDVFMP